MPVYPGLSNDGERSDARSLSAHTPNSPRPGRARTPRGRKEVGVVGNASWASSVINLVNTIVGAGVLAMPLALSRMGMLLGIIVIVWSGVTAGFGLHLQTKCARYLDRGSASFFALSQITYPNAAVVFDAAIAIKCFGVGVSYLIIIGNLMPGVMRGFDEDLWGMDTLGQRTFWVTGFMLIVIPLSFLRKLDSLKYTSFIGLVSIGYLVVLVLAHFIKSDTMPDDKEPDLRFVEWQSLIATLSSFPVIVFAYTCHQNMFSVLNEIGNNSHFRTGAVVIASIGVSAFIYILVAVTGYISFGNSVTDNIVANYSPSVSSTIGKAAIVILVLVSYPLQVHPCRASVDAVLKWRPGRYSSSLSSHPNSPQRATSLSLHPPKARNDTISERRFAVITALILVASYIIAMTVESLSKVLAYVGSTGSTSISFILPGLFYYKISSPDSPLHQRLMKEDDDEPDDVVSGDEDEGLLGGRGLSSLRWSSGRWRRRLVRRLSLALAVYGIVVMVVCLVTTTLFSVVH